MVSDSTNDIGPRERHLLRRRGNPLFPARRRHVSDKELARARRQDEEQKQAFLQRFQNLVQQAADLKPNESSDNILELKAGLDRAYVECSALAGDNEKILQAIRRLVDVAMQAVSNAAGSDPTARQELEQEGLARQTNYGLLHYPLVADLMLPDAPVGEDELVPALLSEDADAVEAALWLFDTPQLEKLGREARELLSALEEQGQRPPQAWARLEQIEQAAGANPH